MQISVACARGNLSTWAPLGTDVEMNMLIIITLYDNVMEYVNIAAERAAHAI